MDLEPVAEAGEVRLPRVAVGCVDRKACSHNYTSTRAQEFQGCLKPYFHPRAGDQRVLAAQVRGLLAFCVVEITARLAHGVVVAVHPHKRLLADIARALLVKLRSLTRVLGLWRLEPQGRVHFGLPLDPQAGALDDLAVALFRGFALGAAKRL